MTETNNNKIEVYTLKETASMLKISYVFMSQLVKEGKIQAVRVGKRKLITRQALEEFLEKNKC